MSDDTLHLNTRGRKQQTFDAIVVGSGITGGFAAKELCERGLKVVMVERGRNMDHPGYPTALLPFSGMDHRGQLTAEDRRNSHVQCRHWVYRGDNKHFFINDLENPYTEQKRYDWIRADVVGGRSLLWGRHCYRMSDLDFAARELDGQGADWPLRYREIAPWYDYVEQVIGVSGNSDGIAHLPDGKYLPPMEMNCVEKEFATHIKKNYRDRQVIIGRVANLTAPVKGRGLCQFRNLCDRGCPFGAYFSTNAVTLPAAFATGNLTLRANALVNSVLYDSRSARATGIELIDTETGQVTEIYAKIIFLNAATLASTFILLNSVSDRFPEGLGNDSGQLGRNLMDNHKGSGASADVDGFTDKYYYGRRANQLIIPQFRNVTERRKDYLRGFMFNGEAGRQGWKHFPAEGGIGASFKDGLTEPGPWKINFMGTGECLSYPDNRVYVNTEVKDRWGRNTLTIDAAFRDNEMAMEKDMASSMAEMLEGAGYRNVRPRETISFPGNSNHEMGTARMGNDPKTSVLNKYNQMHNVKNVFVTDGSCMVTNPCVNPSLTYMALTARACDYAVREMKKRNI